MRPWRSSRKRGSATRRGRSPDTRRTDRFSTSASRGTGSGPAGAAVAPPGSVLVDMERVGACDARGYRHGLFRPRVVDAQGKDVDLTKAGLDDALYVRIGAGRTSDETNRALAGHAWTVAVGPSSGYSPFGGGRAAE